MKLLAGTFEQQIANYDHGSYKAEKVKCHGCGCMSDECINKDDVICCPECAPYWDEWCDSYNEGLIEWCEFCQYIARINYNKTIQQHYL